jgi:nucleoside-diphosphate-sugar epimerase
MPSKVFISGALGLIGSALADRYREQGVEVRGVDLRADASNGVVAGDIAEPGAWQDHARGCDVVVNTAAVVGFGGQLDAVWRANVLGTRRMTDAAARGGAERFAVGEIFTIADGITVEIGAFFAHYTRRAGQAPSADRPDRNGEDDRDRRRGYEPKIDLEEGMRRCEQWLRSEGLLPQG